MKIDDAKEIEFNCAQCICLMRYYKYTKLKKNNRSIRCDEIVFNIYLYFFCIKAENKVDTISITITVSI